MFRKQVAAQTPTPSKEDHSPLSAKALKGAWVLLLALLGWMFIWLYFTANTTIADRDAAVPRTIVNITRIDLTAPASSALTIPDSIDSIPATEPQTPSTDVSTVTETAPIAEAETPAPMPMQEVAPLPAAETPAPPAAETPTAKSEPTKGTPVVTVAVPPNASGRIAIVVKNLGLNKDLTNSALTTLPGPVTFAFSPYAKGLVDWQLTTQNAGHDFMMEVPMEPHTFPDTDPGPMALLSILTPKDNADRLTWILNQTSGYKGILTEMGSRYTALETFMQPFMLEAQKRNLFVVDSRATVKSLIPTMANDLNLPIAESDRLIDYNLSSLTIQSRLGDLERLALKNGVAVGIVAPYPLSVKEVAAWSKTLAQKNIALVPVASITKVPPDQEQ